ncbi:hypothetical protein ADUPG1_006124 [Aduncisulcus paluster]|uniref:Uncharacterized protein n=1 Tax=Aduncisulcus paluster TaxID=2918883 RepID=A0ABQ5KGV4_9EUKA|nr:hypothetical protein ADUPG1_006124 [Aduncisulcus paluster]
MKLDLEDIDDKKKKMEFKRREIKQMNEEQAKRCVSNILSRVQVDYLHDYHSKLKHRKDILLKKDPQIKFDCALDELKFDDPSEEKLMKVCDLEGSFLRKGRIIGDKKASFEEDMDIFCEHRRLFEQNRMMLEDRYCQLQRYREKRDKFHRSGFHDIPIEQYQLRIDKLSQAYDRAKMALPILQKRLELTKRESDPNPISQDNIYESLE